MEFEMSKNTLKKLKFTDHFYERAQERFCMNKTQSEIWIRTILNRDDLNVTASRDDCFKITANKVVIIYNKTRNQIKTVFPSCVQDSYLADLMIGINRLPIDIKDKMKETLLKSVKSHTRLVLKNQIKNIDVLNNLIKSGSKTCQPKLLSEKYQEVCEKNQSIANDLRDNNKLLIAIKHMDDLNNLSHDLD